jgi:NAD(P)-dependent dehydrogenase (short-subunit alcohol dehydrogenase family)
MTTLVVGASGKTGRLLARELLDRGEQVRAIVRSPEALPDALRGHPRMALRCASLLDLSDAGLQDQVDGCEAVASCLGHNLTWRGIFGSPRRLVADATRRLCDAIRARRSGARTRFVLMNTAGNSNRDLAERLSLAERGALGLIRMLLPPHVDNEAAADYLRTAIGRHDPAIGWVAVRPDSLVDEDVVTEYDVHASPIRSALFNPGVTSRINVARFMADLILHDEVWDRWNGQMPVIYNRQRTPAARGAAEP